MNKFVKIVGGLLGALAITGGVYINSQRDAFIKDAVTMVEKKASEYVGTQIKIGSVDVDEINLSKLTGSSITVKNIELLDKNSETMATVDKAEIDFKLLSLYDDGAGAVDEIKITGAHVDLKKRDDNSWNFDDIKFKSEGESTFDAKIFVNESSVNAQFDGKEISVTDISAAADCADMTAIDTTLSANVLDSHVDATGILGADKQVVNAKIDSVDVTKFLTYIPEGTLPEALEIHGGTLNQPSIHVTRNGEILNYLVSSEISNGAVKVEDTTVENIVGNVTLNEKEIWFNADAVANGQFAAASGKVRTDTGEPFFDIYAESENFSPSAIIPNIGVDGAFAFTAHLVGTAQKPLVEADIFSPYAAYSDVSGNNLRAHLNYGNDRVYLSDVSGETFGGTFTGDVAVYALTKAFTANVKAFDIDAAQILNYIQSDVDLNGKISGDVSINGTGTELDKLKIFGSAQMSRADFQGFAVDDAKTSFYYDNKILKIDNFNAVLPNRGAVGVEGEIENAERLNLKFFASHVDLSTAQSLNENLQMSGLADLSGEIHGDISNPQLDVKLSAVDSASNGGEHFKGIFLKQPYDSIKLAASGSLDEIKLSDFELEKGGKVIWSSKSGTVNLRDKLLNVEINTTGARVEDIVALVAPDENFTGNIDNKIKITGSFDNPNVVGEVHFNIGSYRGILISSIDGEYFYEGDQLRLQNVFVQSPMADVILDGTFEKATGALDFVVEGKDLSLKRIRSKLPENYNAEGHATFEGVLRGTIDNPRFIGQIDSEALTLNGVDVTDVHGQVEVLGNNYLLEEFRFSHGGGNCKMHLHIDDGRKTLNGLATVQNFDIGALLALADYKNVPLNGNLDSTITIGGKIRDPFIEIKGAIPQGDIAGHDIHAVEVDVNLLNQEVNFNKLHGRQGDDGTFSVTGKIDRLGDLNLNFAAKDLELAMFSAAAGLDLDVTGTTDISAKISGMSTNPLAQGTLTASGSVNGATFDLLQADVGFKDWTFDIKELFVQRAIADSLYKASASGKIPVEALYIDRGRPLSADEQLNITVELDDADLSLLPVVNDFVAWAVGDMDGQIKITGTAKTPQVNGKISVSDGTIKFKHVDSPIEHLNIATAFKGDRFDIENFTGNVGDGIFTVNGGFNFANFEISDYNFNLKADNLEMRGDFFDGPLNAEFSLGELQFFGRKFPKVAGHLDLDKCTISIPAIPDSDDPLPHIALDVSLNLGDKVHLYQSHLYDMYLTGSARFEGSTLHPKPSGSISVKRGGTLTYLNSVFDIHEGEAHFNQIESFFPTIHFYADTKMSRTKIFLYLDGTLNNMKVTLGSSPEMTETEIIQVLTLRENYEKGTQNIAAADVLAIGLQMSILGDIEDTVRRTLGFDQFRLTRGTGSAFDYYSDREDKKENEFNIFIGKYITDKIMLRYTQGINGDKVSRYGFQYDFNDNIGFTVERERGQYIFGLEARFKF